MRGDGNTNDMGGSSGTAERPEGYAARRSFPVILS